jgi:hypothetical protein
MKKNAQNCLKSPCLHIDHIKNVEHLDYILGVCVTMKENDTYHFKTKDHLPHA